MEIDILLNIDKNDVHYLSYILEAQDNMVNIRKYEGGILRIITTDYFKKDILKMLDSLKMDIDFDIVEIRKNSGSAD
ncbi:hypothetical protein BG95_00340 [Thermosipho sp. 1063]|uniref:DUF4911 domain-containing protein n=1 Tax=unclassified Thermosipho (in: thermotogales) TaxID=2676525 RepID=UPI00094921BF|nr:MULTISPECIES: DUF4911 domain-containing protein [unclassified Thermosipho (in: thermotogales)]ANQ52998.1 hypothetical protein Y592_00345 [Thermosipho sp. 1070]APT71445.1 hypothetical protein BG95_00340 [Thermosipho sp. 1063]OOC45520.1 hypothetical protein XO08_00350 [Thermosipho sp. 1074]